MAQAKPIAPCMVFYKIVSKMLVHKLQIFMNKIISANQSAFVKGAVNFRQYFGGSQMHALP